MGYTRFDRLVAWFRFRVGLRYVRSQSRVCDLGCGLHAQFLRMGRARIRFGVGVDYQVDRAGAVGLPLVCADITRGLPFRNDFFDHTVVFAVLEHLTDPAPVLREVFRILAPGGSLIMTYPRAVLDPLLAVLHHVGLVSREMESEKHERRVPLPELLALMKGIGFERCVHRTFEFRLNNLVIAPKPR